MPYLPNPFYEVLLSAKAARPGNYQRLANYLCGYGLWQCDSRFAAAYADRYQYRKATVILLSYKRPRNIQPIVRSLLKASCVEKVIVSNNNPDVRLEDWLQLRDERLHVVHQSTHRACGVRFEIARQDGSEYFLAIDDDVLLFPRQVDEFFGRLLDTPSIPHGLNGCCYLEQPLRACGATARHRDGWLGGFVDVDAPVHVVSGGYAFTQRHVVEMYRLAAQLDINVGALFDDDVLLSFGGSAPPHCAKVGRLLACPSSTRPSVAVSKQAGFHRRRAELYNALRALKPSLHERAAVSIQNDARTSERTGRIAFATRCIADLWRGKARFRL